MLIFSASYTDLASTGVVAYTRNCILYIVYLWHALRAVDLIFSGQGKSPSREMNEVSLKKYTANPYEDLYIYYLEGCVGREPENHGGGFIGNWEEDGFSFLFFSRPTHDEVERIVRARPGLVLLDTYHMSYDEWQGGSLTPFQAGGFLIHPPWAPPENSDAAAPDKRETPRIVLDPGVVFGAGAHLTTRDCLGAVRMACRGGRVETVLDLGTGTGILAIAAARLGCKRVLAADLNLLAARTARNNILLNGLENRVLAVRARAEDLIHIPGDLVVANIHHEVMRSLIESDGFLAKKWFVLSGLMRSEAKAVEEALARKSMVILEKWVGDGIWCTYFGKIG